MSPGQLRNQILMAVRRDVGLRLDELCEITGAPMAEVRSTCWALTNTGALDYCRGGYFRASSTEESAPDGDGFVIPAGLRAAMLVPRQGPRHRQPARVTPGAFRARGMPVPEHPAQMNVYQLTGRQGLPWSPGVDVHIGRRGGELLGGNAFLCVDCDTTLAVDGSVWLDGFRWLMDAATTAGEILDLTACLTVRTPGDRDRGHAPGWHLWWRADPDRPVRFGPLRRCPVVEIKNRCTAPGSPGYQVCHVPAELPALPRWLAEIAGPPRVRAATSPVAGAVPAESAQKRLRGILGCLLAAERGGRNQLLFWSALRAGELVAAGALDPGAAEKCLHAAAADIGLVSEDGDQAVMATIRSGFERAGVAHAAH